MALWVFLILYRFASLTCVCSSRVWVMTYTGILPILVCFIYTGLCVCIGVDCIG